MIYSQHKVLVKSGLQKPLFTLRMEELWQKDKKTLRKPSLI